VGARVVFRKTNPVSSAGLRSRRADDQTMDPSRLEEVLNRYAARRLVFDHIAARRRGGTDYPTFPRGLSPDSPLLSPREIEVLASVAAGETNGEIAERLFLSDRTVSAHLYRVFPKLGITSRAALRDALVALGDHGRAA